jgi:hypothetical protein
MKKAPAPTKVQRAHGEQLSFLPPAVFLPKLPPPHSFAAIALCDLQQGSITQIDWLKRGLSWRLAAAIKELGYLGWEPQSTPVCVEEWERPIALYSLPAHAKQAAYSMSHGGAAPW